MPSLDVQYHNTSIFQSDESCVINCLTEATYLDAPIRITFDASIPPQPTQFESGTLTTEISNVVSVPSTKSNIILYAQNGDVQTIVHNQTFSKYAKQGLWWSIQSATVEGGYTILSGISGLQAGKTLKWVAYNV